MTRKMIQMQPVAQVPPLRARKKKTNELYVRRPEIEQLLVELWDVPVAQIARRADIVDESDTEYLPPEVLVHYLRRSKAEGDSAPYREIFVNLRQRLLQRLPVSEKRRAGGRVIENRKQSDVRQQVLDRVMEILSSDRREYDTRLDYYEINFNGAVARARRTAWRDLLNSEENDELQSLDIELASEEGARVDEALRCLRGVSESFSDFIYRSEVFSAINSLPDEEREVIFMLVEGFKIKEIAKTAGCTEKTVSARRDRARVRLSETLNKEKKS